MAVGNAEKSQPVFAGCFGGARDQFLHFSAAINRNVFILNHSDNVAAMLKDMKFLFYIISSIYKSISPL